MMKNCFQIYFNPMYLYIKRAFNLAFDNEGGLFWSAAFTSFSLEMLRDIFNINYFGVSNFVLALVIGTILIDAFYGVKKSLKESRQAKVAAEVIGISAPEKKKFLKVHELKKFKLVKLQYTFFKVLTLLGYLFFVKNILTIEDEESVLAQVIGFSSAIVLKAPLIIFWYYDFKSIGDNSAFVYNKKAPIFVIVEKILEPKISKFFNKE